MASTGFLITLTGQAAATVSNPGGPYINIAEFRAGSGVNYTPIGYVPGVSATSQTALQGTTLYTGVPSGYTVVSSDTIEVTLQIPPTVSSMNFGEIGIYLSNGTLFAICVFDTLQAHEHAVGNQAGTNWRIRARLKLQQLPAICQVTLVNSQSLLEVPDWPSLFRPDLQPTGANAAIVHDNDDAGDPVLVVRDSAQEWGLIAYSRILDDTTVGATVTTTSYDKAPIASLSLDLPSTTSKYLIKLPDGSIRKIVSGSGQSITWSPPVGAAPSGQVQIFQSNSVGQRVSWVDTLEYNQFVTDINRWWSALNGTWALDSNGLGQPALATLTRRTTLADWQAALNVITNLCTIHGISVSDITPYDYDFVYRPLGSTPGGMQRLMNLWNLVQHRFVLLNQEKFNISNAAHDFTAYPALIQNEYFSLKRFKFDFTFASQDEYRRAIHGGMQFLLGVSCTSAIDPSWVQLQTLLTRVGSLTLKGTSIVRNGPGPTGTITETNVNPPSSLGSYRDQPIFPGYVTQYQATDSATGWRLTYGREFLTSGPNYLLSVLVTLDDTAGPTYYSGGSPGQLNFTWTVNRPQAVYVGSPVIPFPTLTAVILP